MLLACCCDPPPPETCARRTFVIESCGALTGATLTLTLGGTTIFSGVLSGHTYTTDLLESGTYNWTVTHPSSRVTSASGSFTITCPTGDATINVTLPPATGYRCFCGNRGTTEGAGLPVSETLNGSIDVPGAPSTYDFTLAYNAGTGEWVGTVVIPWGGCPGLGCASSNRTLTVRVPVSKIAQCNSTCEINVSGDLNVFPCGLNMISSMTCTAYTSPVPALLIEATVTGVVFGGCSDVTATITITE